jgi:hypothetical protein
MTIPWSDSLLWTDHTKTAQVADGSNTGQLFCERHDLDVHLSSDVCRHVLEGEPVDRVFYRYSRSSGVYVASVVCGNQSSHASEDFFAACPACLDELLVGHPKAMREADRQTWEAQEAVWRAEAHEHER